jgi:hypothetical protein
MINYAYITGTGTTTTRGSTAVTGTATTTSTIPTSINDHAYNPTNVSIPPHDLQILANDHDYAAQYLQMAQGGCGGEAGGLQNRILPGKHLRMGIHTMSLTVIPRTRDYRQCDTMTAQADNPPAPCL